MTKYVVQCKYPNGEIGLSVNTPKQIIDMVGFADCSACEYEVFAGDTFGAMIKLTHLPMMSAPYNFQQFYNPATGRIEFEGFSPEH